jgi:hypothetical protein
MWITIVPFVNVLQRESQRVEDMPSGYDVSAADGIVVR